MKFTKKQRNKIYRSALDEHLKLNTNERLYLCHSLSNISNLNQSGLFIFLPEFKIFSPHVWGERGAWFVPDNGYNGWDYCDLGIKDAQRMILLFCIEITN